MRIIAVTGGKDGTLALALSGRRKTIDATLLSPLDARVHFLDVPRVKDEHIDGAVRIKLRAHYPGRIDDLAIHATGSTLRGITAPERRRNATFFSLPKGILSDIRSRRGSIYHPLTVLERFSALSARPDAICVFAAEGWREYALMSGGLAVSEATATTAKAGILSEAIELLGIQDPEGRDILVLAQNEEIRESVIAESRTREAKSFEARTLTRSGLDLRPRADAAFAEREYAGRRLFALAPLLLLALNLVVFLAHGHLVLADKRARLADLKARHALYQRTIEKIRDIRATIADDSLSNPKRKDFMSVDAYDAISLVAGGLRGAQVRSLVVEASTFRVTCSGPDAVTTLAALAGNPRLADVTLVQSSLDGDDEIFTISGGFSDD